jgi:hypothetical protein
MGVDRAVTCGECLQDAHAPDAQHDPVPSSKRLVCVLGSVGEAAV